MVRLTVEHKNCKCTKVIEGNDLYDAFRKTNTDMTVWNVIEIEKI